ncbi:MAG: YidC/Oxa1 family membrane protein insertase [Candidatus Saccharibacteria bacterium]
MGAIWDWLVLEFVKLIHWCYELSSQAGVPSYALAIVMVTFIIKVILLPLTQKQLKSMREMQMLQPKLKEIQKLYSDNPEKMNMETMNLYKEHGVNPLGGCLPVLIQLPFLYAFYAGMRVLFDKTYKPGAAILKDAHIVVNQAHSGLLWIPSMGAHDPLYILPILAGLTTYIQQRISTVDPSDPMQKNMLFMMPAMITFFGINLPSGLVLYWVVLNILSIVQQLYINKTNTLQVVGAGNEIPVAVESETSGTGSNKGGKNNESGGKKGKKR